MRARLRATVALAVLGLALGGGPVAADVGLAGTFGTAEPARGWVLHEAGAVLTWYGEGFIGARTSCSWCGGELGGLPHRVDAVHHGLAAWRPCGEEVRLTVRGTCWGEAMPVRRARGVVVDRMAVDRRARYDAWPALFAALSGDRLDLGCIIVDVEVASWHTEAGHDQGTVGTGGCDVWCARGGADHALDGRESHRLGG